MEMQEIKIQIASMHVECVFVCVLGGDIPHRKKANHESSF